MDLRSNANQALYDGNGIFVSFHGLFHLAEKEYLNQKFKLAPAALSGEIICILF